MIIHIYKSETKEDAKVSKGPESVIHNIIHPTFTPNEFNQAKRCRLLTKKTLSLNINQKSFDSTKASVIYWMSRDQRVDDNYALLYAQQLAAEYKTKLIVVFNLVPIFYDATIRQFDFMLKGLQEVEEQLNNLNIPFKMLMGDPIANIPKVKI